MDKKTHDKGREIRKAVLGEAYVANALKNADDFNKPFQELVTEYCWGAVWGREQLPRKTRSMLNLAMISILNRPHELRVQLKGGGPPAGPSLFNPSLRAEGSARSAAPTAKQSMARQAERWIASLRSQ